MDWQARSRFYFGWCDDRYGFRCRAGCGAAVPCGPATAMDYANAQHEFHPAMNQVEESAGSMRWLPMLRRYFAVVLLGNLVWEVGHLPLYTLWITGTLSEKAFAVAHCTAGDLMIGAAALLCTLLAVGDARWPEVGFARVTALATITGVAYTVFSEWLNIGIRGSWAYTAAMPVVPYIGIGLTPLLQWIVVPSAAFWFARRHVMPSPQRT